MSCCRQRPAAKDSVYALPWGALAIVGAIIVATLVLAYRGC